VSARVRFKPVPPALCRIVVCPVFPLARGPSQNGGLSPIPLFRAETFATERIYASKAEAISHIFENLERDLCERCTARIFRECKRVPRRTEGVVPIET